MAGDFIRNWSTNRLCVNTVNTTIVIKSDFWIPRQCLFFWLRSGGGGPLIFGKFRPPLADLIDFCLLNTIKMWGGGTPASKSGGGDKHWHRLMLISRKIDCWKPIRQLYKFHSFISLVGELLPTFFFWPPPHFIQADDLTNDDKMALTAYLIMQDRAVDAVNISLGSW